MTPKIYGKSLARAIIFCFSVLFSISSIAIDAAMIDLLKILHDKGSITTDEYKTLVNAAKSDKEKNLETISKVSSKTIEKQTPFKIETKGKLKISSKDGAYSFQPVGRIFWDSVWASEDDSTDVDGGSELRRARIGFQAQFLKNWKAKLEYDFVDSGADLKDAWISYNNKLSSGQKYSIKVGQHHVPFGFHTISSSKSMSFLRRPLFADGPLSPARQYGLGFSIVDKRWLVHAGVFLKEPEDGEVNVDNAGEDAKTLAIRVAGTPIMRDEKHLLHIGASYMHINLSGDDLRIRQRAISHLDNGRMFNTGNFGDGVIDSVNAFDLEALAIYGPFYALGEYVSWALDNNGNGAEHLSAWSLEAGWFLTGESMKYKQGKFSNISPNNSFNLANGGLGAWQIVARFENMDLNDRNTIGGDGDIFSAGINWFPIKNIRFMATYNKLLSFKRAGYVNDDTSPSSFSIRSMVYW